MKVLDWIFSTISASVIIVLLGMFGGGSAFVGQANADDSASAYHISIVKVERVFTHADFDISRKQDILRKTRIAYYLAEAKQADIRNWTFKRDDLVSRAKGILIHHQTQYRQPTTEVASS